MTRVAAYCRVSTDSLDQLHSFESQKLFFQQYISGRPGWTLYEIYADEGITGTSTEDRTGFLRMIDDAQKGRFELILTKEVSRFSRNILDAVAYTRLLKKSGVGVLFLNDGISTLEPDAELRLGIMASVAQEESRKTSERVKWGQRRKMERGVVFGRSLLGYDVRSGTMTIEPSGAETVRRIFDMYVRERMGIRAIAGELSRHGIKTAAGNSTWSGASVLKILRNEKYCGDLRQRKMVTKDYLTHKKTRNLDENDMIFISGHHKPIVSRDMWEIAQAELTRRSPGRKVTSNDNRTPARGNRYCLSGRIVCGNCGTTFLCRTRKRKNGTHYRVWRPQCICQGKRRQVREDAVDGCIRRFIAGIGRERLLYGFEEVLERAARYTATDVKAVEAEIRAMERKAVKLADAYVAEDIGRDAYLELRNACDDCLLKLRGELRHIAETVGDEAVTLFNMALCIAEGRDDDSDFYLGLVELAEVRDSGAGIRLKDLPEMLSAFLQ